MSPLASPAPLRRSGGSQPVSAFHSTRPNFNDWYEGGDAGDYAEIRARSNDSDERWKKRECKKNSPFQTLKHAFQIPLHYHLKQSNLKTNLRKLLVHWVHPGFTVNQINIDSNPSALTQPCLPNRESVRWDPKCLRFPRPSHLAVPLRLHLMSMAPPSMASTQTRMIWTKQHWIFFD